MLKYFDLTGEVAVVTGASQGLGERFAKGLAEAGADLFLIARNEDNLKAVAADIEKMGRECGYCAADITDEEAVNKAVAGAMARFGKLDILINNAAASRDNRPPEDTTVESFNRVMNTNVTGAFICARAVGKEMIKRRKGKIVNIGSMSAMIINKGVHGGSYDISKSAVLGLTRALAMEWVGYNINVNCICPGYFLTEPNIEFLKENPEFDSISKSMIPAGRWGNIEELIGGIIFLSSGSANYMNGSSVVIDGGYTSW